MRREFQQPLFAAYVDIKAAFDSLDRDVLWFLLRGIGVPAKYSNIIKDLYTNTTCRVRVDGSLSDSFPTTSGVRQGCVLAPNLFNIAIDYWLIRAFNRCPDLGSNFHHQFTDLDYADDIVLFANTVALLADALTTLSEEASPLGLSISWAKTKLQSLSDFLPQPPSRVIVNDNEVETVRVHLPRRKDHQRLLVGSRNCSSDAARSWRLWSFISSVAKSQNHRVDQDTHIQRLCAANPPLRQRIVVIVECRQQPHQRLPSFLPSLHPRHTMVRPNKKQRSVCPSKSPCPHHYQHSQGQTPASRTRGASGRRRACQACSRCGFSSTPDWLVSPSQTSSTLLGGSNRDHPDHGIDTWPAHL